MTFSDSFQFDPIKTGVVSVLSNINTPEARQMWLSLLEHDSAHIVNWAADALGKRGGIEALSAMSAASKRIGRQPMIERAIARLPDPGTNTRAVD